MRKALVLVVATTLIVAAIVIYISFYKLETASESNAAAGGSLRILAAGYATSTGFGSLVVALSSPLPTYSMREVASVVTTNASYYFSSYQNVSSDGTVNGYHEYTIRLSNTPNIVGYSLYAITLTNQSGGSAVLTPYGTYVVIEPTENSTILVNVP